MRNLLLYCFLLIIAAASLSWSQPRSMPGNAAMINEAQFVDSSKEFADRIIQSKVPVLVDFWAVWCGPCRMLGPTIEELKKEYAGKIQVIKVNVDIHRGLAAYFRVSSIPAVFIITNKTVVDYLLGCQPKETYKKAIDKAQKGAAASPVKGTEKTPAKPLTKQAPPAEESVTTDDGK